MSQIDLESAFRNSLVEGAFLRIARALDLISHRNFILGKSS